MSNEEALAAPSQPKPKSFRPQQVANIMQAIQILSENVGFSDPQEIPGIRYTDLSHIKARNNPKHPETPVIAQRAIKTLLSYFGFRDEEELIARATELVSPSSHQKTEFIPTPTLEPAERAAVGAAIEWLRKSQTTVIGLATSANVDRDTRHC